MYFFLKKKSSSLFIFSKIGFSCILQKNLWWVLYKGKLQSEHCWLANLLKETQSQKFFWEISEVSQSFIFRSIFICVEKAHYMKDYMKAQLENKSRIRRVHLVY